MAASPIEILIIRQDESYQIDKVPNDIKRLSHLVGGHLQAKNTPTATFWFNSHSKREKLPINHAATYLWWKLDPASESRDTINGPCVVTGPANDTQEATDVYPDVLDLHTTIDLVREEVRP